MAEPATVHEHWFTPFAQVFGPYGPQDIHYHPCVEGKPGDCDAVMAGAGGRECHGTRSPHLRMDLTEDGLQPAEALSTLRATAPVAAKAEPPPRRYSFTRDQLIEAVSRLEAYPAKLKSGRVVIMAESMADAIIEGLGDA